MTMLADLRGCYHPLAEETAGQLYHPTPATPAPSSTAPLSFCTCVDLHNLRNNLHNLVRLLVSRPTQRDRLAERFHRRLPQARDRPARHLQRHFDREFDAADDFLHFFPRFGDALQDGGGEGGGDVGDALVGGAAQAFAVEARLAGGAGGFLFAVAVGDFDAFSSGGGWWLVEAWERGQGR